MLAKALELGSCGVQWQPPDGTIGEHTDTVLAVRDDTDLRWRVRLLPTEFAIAPGEEAALSEDLYASAKASFERRWAQQPRPSGSQPRTADGEWSPIIEAKIGLIGDGRMARAVRRLSYEPGDEIVIGHLFIPVEKGTVEIRVLARHDQVGVRENAVARKYGGKQPQATYDARELDPYFPAHPLSRVRTALDGVVGSLEIVTKPERPAELLLSEPGCAISAPPRFTHAPPATGTGKGELTRLGVDDWKRVIEVWRMGRQKFKLQRDLHTSLVDHANQVAADGAKHGQSQIQSRAKPIDDYGVCSQIQQYVTYVDDSGARHAVYRWWVAGDGTLWRIGEHAPIAVDREQIADDVASVQDSFRRI